MGATLLALLGITPYTGGSGGAAAAPAAGVVDVFFASTSGAGDISLSSASLVDLSGLTVTVTNTQVGDKLMISSLITAYSDSGGGAIYVSYDIDGAAAKSTTAQNWGPRIGYATPGRGKWVHTVGAGDITGGNTIVKVQVKKTGAGMNIINSADGISTLSVVRVRS